MPTESKSRRDLWFNLDLVLKEAQRWPVATTIVAVMICALVVVHAINEPRADSIYLVVGVIGYLSGILGMKAGFHLMAYAMINKAPFPGSYLVATALAMIPIFVFYSCGFYILGVQRNEFPPLAAILILFGVGYPLCTIFFAGFFRAQEWIQLNRQKRRTNDKPPAP